MRSASSIAISAAADAATAIAAPTTRGCRSDQALSGAIRPAAALRARSSGWRRDRRGRSLVALAVAFQSLQRDLIADRLHRVGQLAVRILGVGEVVVDLGAPELEIRPSHRRDRRPARVLEHVELRRVEIPDDVAALKSLALRAPDVQLRVSECGRGGGKES